MFRSHFILQKDEKENKREEQSRDGTELKTLQEKRREENRRWTKRIEQC